MPFYGNPKRSFREVARFFATDQNGMRHTVVQRIETLQDIGSTGLVIENKQGISCFYSATSGDAVMAQADGSFTTQDGRLKLFLCKD